MTNEETKNYLSGIVGDGSMEFVSTPIKTEVLQAAIKALDKKIPKSGYDAKTKLCVCPTCKRLLEGYEKFCWNCGQAIDWSEVRG